jgi:hypothetical protein
VSCRTSASSWFGANFNRGVTPSRILPTSLAISTTCRGCTYCRYPDGQTHMPSCMYLHQWINTITPTDTGQSRVHMASAQASCARSEIRIGFVMVIASCPAPSLHALCEVDEPTVTVGESRRSETKIPHTSTQRQRRPSLAELNPTQPPTFPTLPTLIIHPPAYHSLTLPPALLALLASTTNCFLAPSTSIPVLAPSHHSACLAAPL